MIPHGWQPDANLLQDVIFLALFCFLSLYSPLFYGGISYLPSATGSCVSAATLLVGTCAHAALLVVPACPLWLSTLLKPGEGVTLFWFN